MNLTDFTSIAIVGVVFSLALQWVKGKFGVDTNGTKIATVILALVIGTVYVWIQGTAYFQTILTVLGSASTFYALFLRK
jgi:Na+-transporting NADH:ubiquinone oxidoreductase subunit NqrB